LIGHTGFVGGVLKASHDFTDLYNSANFRTMAGSSFDTLVCAGVSAVKWAANKDPDGDWAAIARLVEVLDRVTTAEMILISTIDVYPDPSLPLDETAVIDPEANHVYGRHRFRLETWVRERFPLARVVRLPALFGSGLKKNALYDLIHDNGVEKINPAGVFQWYPLTRLWPDLEIVRAQDLRLVNLFTAPLAMHRIIDGFFPGAGVAPPTQPAPVYRLQTRYADLFGGAHGYIMSAEACYAEIGSFVDAAQGKTA
jgi:hypothetical protein